ncbi:MAG: hypothetical protein GY759_16665 [Chloroflexi bacterium]|nr:hypothetical protein [Chloroflexota bacterium]
MMADQRLRRSLTYESVLEHLQAQFLHGKLMVGETAIRVAYHILEWMGMLEVVQGSRTFGLVTSAKNDTLLRQLQLAGRQALAHLQEARNLLSSAVAGGGVHRTVT